MLNRSHGLRKVARGTLCRSVAPSAFATAGFRCFSSSPFSSYANDVGILGGGITGLAAAYYLSHANPNTKITIYEASPRLGGWLHSEKVEIDDGHILFEKGPRTLRPVGTGALTARLVSDLGLADDTIFTMKTAPAATNRYLYYPDHLVRVPQPDKKLGFFGNASMFANAFTYEEAFQGILSRVLLEPFRPERDADVSDESVGDFFARRIGRKFVDQVLSAVIHGIYAGDVYQLSMKSLFPGMWKLESDAGSLIVGFIQTLTEGALLPSDEVKFLMQMKQPYSFDKDFRRNFRKSSVFTFRNGIQQLVDKLEETIRGRHNITVRLNAKATNIVEEDGRMNIHVQPSADGGDASSSSHSHVISTLSPDKVMESTGAPESFGSNVIAPAPTVATVNLYFRTPGLHPAGFGYLIPRATSMEQNPERALGVVFDTAYSASHIGDEDFRGPMQDSVSNRGTKLTVMLGGHYWDDWSSYPSNDEALQMAQSVLERHLGITEKPAAHSVNINYNCIPQYTVGFEDRVKNVHDELLRKYSGRYRVAGNWIRGVGVNDCIRSAYDVAQALEEDGLTGLEPVVQPKKWIRVKTGRK